MNFCPGRSEHTWLWPEKEGGFDDFLRCPSRAIHLWLPPFAQHAVLYVSFLVFFLRKLSIHFEFFHR